MKNQLEGFLFEFCSTDNLVLHGFLHKTTKNNSAVIIYLPGMCGSFYRSGLVYALGLALKGSKFDFMTINTRGAGLINKVYREDGRHKMIGTSCERFEDCLHDINGAIQKAKSFGYKKFVLAGHSTGCQKITYYQVKSENQAIKALLLLAPADDYNLDLKKKGKKFQEQAVKKAKEMIRKGKASELMPSSISNYSAKRYLSFADLKNVEANIFNYTSDLKLFSKVKIPIFAAFGTKETKTQITPKQMLCHLEQRSNSTNIKTCLIEEANHGFFGKEAMLVRDIRRFVDRLIYTRSQKSFRLKRGFLRTGIIGARSATR